MTNSALATELHLPPNYDMAVTNEGGQLDLSIEQILLTYSLVTGTTKSFH